ncbi:MAG: hypothetical protein WB643_10010 [Candidatus Bathyarchaeia archaeon]
MSSSDQQLTKKLAEMKTFLERRLKQQEEEVTYLRSFLEVVDSLLAERSFRPVEISKPSEPEPAAKPKMIPKGADSVPVLTVDGVRIGSIQVEQGALHVTSEPDINLDSNSPPLRSFLLAKVLEPMQTKDKEAASAGTIPPEAILTYNVEQDDGRLRAIHIQNYGDDRRLLELKNAIRWTLRRMYEKTGGNK